MNMVLPQKCSKKHIYGGYGGCCRSYGKSVGLMSRNDYYHSESCFGSDLELITHMAEEESRNNSHDLNEATASSSKDVHVHDQEEIKDEGWLQLSIGCQNNINHENKHDDHQVENPRLVELDLLRAPMFHVPEFRPPYPRPVSNVMGAATTCFNPSMFFQNPSGFSSNFLHNQEINWGFRPFLSRSLATASSSSSLMPFGSCFAPPVQLLSTGLDVAGGGRGSDVFRVIDPPSRQHSSIWLMLQASQNQAKEPFLPQIPKSYLRIKDGRMTVRLIMKYLVNKLRLDSESEIEITCRGQKVVPLLTLQHVRDEIWSSRDPNILLPHSSTSDYVMLLHYGRTA